MKFTKVWTFNKTLFSSVGLRWEVRCRRPWVIADPTSRALRSDSSPPMAQLHWERTKGGNQKAVPSCNVALTKPSAPHWQWTHRFAPSVPASVPGSCGELLPRWVLWTPLEGRSNAASKHRHSNSTFNELPKSVGLLAWSSSDGPYKLCGKAVLFLFPVFCFLARFCVSAVVYNSYFSLLRVNVLHSLSRTLACIIDSFVDFLTHFRSPLEGIANRTCKNHYSTTPSAEKQSTTEKKEKN